MTPQPHHSIPATVPPPNCFTVLVVDDMLPNRVLLRKVLKNAGYSVLEACNGREALEILRGQGTIPDLIVTDIEMPEMDGIRLIEEVRELDTALLRVPIIAASGNADETMRCDALDAGTDLFLTKPFDLAELRREIARLIMGRRQGIAVRSQAIVPGTSLNRLDVPMKEAG